MIWGQVVQYWARWQPDWVAVRFGEREITWRELDVSTDELAAGLSALGVGHGDRIGILMLNRPEYLETVVATMKLGAIAVPMNVRLTAPEIAYQVANADCAVVVTETALAPALANARLAQPAMAVLNADDGTLDAARVQGGTAPPVRIAATDPLFICYTSGTTGDPKGAVLTHSSWHYAAMCRALQGPITRNDKLLLPFPLAFTGGMAMAMTAIWSGAQLVLEPGFDATRVLHLIDDLAITVFMAVPAIFQALADHPDFDTTDISSIRCASSGGAPVPVSLLKIFLARGIAMTQTYSLTEVSASGITLPYHQTLEKVGSCGVPAMHSEARIVDPETGAELPDGEVGEIAIRGPEVMSGYWRNEAGTAAALRDGWLHTGDLGTRDADGYFRVVDRAKDMLISGGLNVYPAELERTLAALPSVVEVAVVGVPDARWGETPAVVVFTNGPLTGDEVLTACKAELADYKWPRYLVIRDEPLPRNMSGKVLKRQLRDELADLPSHSTPIR
jgi:fatty-acyl-CoA synthase